MAYRWKNTLKESDVTSEAVFLDRRRLMAGMAGSIAAGALAAPAAAMGPSGNRGDGRAQQLGRHHQLQQLL